MMDHLEEFWIIYLWVGLVVALIVTGVIMCDGNSECLKELADSIQ